MKADVLVVNSSLLGFDMLLDMEIIRMLGGIHIDQSGNVIFSRTGPHACAAIRIEEPTSALSSMRRPGLGQRHRSGQVISHPCEQGARVSCVCSTSTRVPS